MKGPFKRKHLEISVPEKPGTQKEQIATMFDYVTNRLPHIIADQNNKIDDLRNFIFLSMALLAIVIALIECLI